jgi:hypothetical protein
MDSRSDSGKMFEFNKNYKRRDDVLGICVDWNNEELHDDLIEIGSMDLDIVTMLLNEKFIDPESRQNESPSVKEFHAFMQKHSSARAFGYAVSPFREDYRISIEGLFVAPDDVTPEIRKAFVIFCAEADELDTDVMLRSWWD